MTDKYVMKQLEEAISYLSEEVEVGERIDEGYDSWSSTDTVYLKHALNALNRIKEHFVE